LSWTEERSKAFGKASVAGWVALVLSGGLPVALAQILAPPERQPRRSSSEESRLSRNESEELADRRRMALTVGEDFTLDLVDFEPAWDKIVIGNPGLLVTTNIPAKKQVILKPVKEGETTVQFRDQEGNLKLVLEVAVAKTNLVRRAEEIRELLRQVEGISVRVVGQRIVVGGEVIVPNDYAEVLKILGDAAYKDLVINQASLSPIGMKLIAEKIEEDVQAFAPKVTTRVVNRVVVVEGVYPPVGPCLEEPSKDANLCLIEKAIALYAPPVLPGISPLLGGEAGVRTKDAREQPWVSLRVRPEAPPPPPPEPPPPPPPPPEPPVEPEQLRITLHFVELSKDYSRLHSFKWQPGFTFDPTITVGTSSAGQTAGAGTSFTGTISSLFPKLRSAENAGFARILKTATVITRDKSEALVEQTTAIPIMTVGQGGVPNQASRDVTFGLKVKPTITPGTASLMLEVKFQNAAVVGRTSSGVLTSQSAAQTSFFMRAGESAAIAAFSTTDVGTDFNKDDPRLQASGLADSSTGGAPAQTDPIFSLLSSKNYRKKKSQVVIFITPEILNNPAAATEDLKKNFRIGAP
jgi:hypothetical protein